MFLRTRYAIATTQAKPEFLFSPGRSWTLYPAGSQEHFNRPAYLQSALQTSYPRETRYRGNRDLDLSIDLKYKNYQNEWGYHFAKLLLRQD
jgi:hypothetical protein